MKKKGSLADALLKTPEVPKRKKQNKQQNISDSTRPPSRQGKKNLSVWVDPDVIKQIKQISIDHDKTAQDLQCEALNSLFAKYHKAQIA